jgi:hypothetical protein
LKHSSKAPQRYARLPALTGAQHGGAALRNQAYPHTRWERETQVSPHPPPFPVPLTLTLLATRPDVVHCTREWLPNSPRYRTGLPRLGLGSGLFVSYVCVYVIVKLPDTDVSALSLSNAKALKTRTYTSLCLGSFCLSIYICCKVRRPCSRKYIFSRITRDRAGKKRILDYAWKSLAESYPLDTS